MKVSSSVKPRCPKCKVIKRRKRSSEKGSKIKTIVYIKCSANPRHNQRQG